MKKIIGTLLVCVTFCMSLNAQSLLKGLKNTVDSAKKTKESVQKATSSSSKKKSASQEDPATTGEIGLETESAFYIYLNLSDTTITDDMYMDYAKTVEYPTYKKYINDEFEWHDKFEEIKAKFNNNVENADVDGKFVIMTTVEIGDYDFTNEGYPFTISEGTFFPFRSINYVTDGASASTDIFRTGIALKIIGLDKYNFLPMEKDKAKTFLQGRKRSSGNINREIAIVCHYEIESFNSKEFKDFEKICKQNNYLPLVGTLSSVEIYDNATKNLVKLADAEQK